MSISTKHHYIPEFYLKGFTNAKSKFFIYDYSKSKIKKGEYSPSSHFFEKNRNTVEHEGKTSDLTEQHYTYSENRHSKLLQKIQSSKLSKLNADELIILQEFVASIFWRIPSNDQLYLEQYFQGPIAKSSHSLISKLIIPSEVNRIKNTPAFINSYRPAAAGISVLRNRNSNFLDWKLIYLENSTRICSDNPIIFSKLKVKDPFDSDLLIPLTQCHLLLRTSKTKLELSEYIGMICDILIFRQGQNYCCCSDKNHLEKVIEMSNKLANEDLKSVLFNFGNGTAS